MENEALADFHCGTIFVFANGGECYNCFDLMSCLPFDV